MAVKGWIEVSDTYCKGCELLSAFPELYLSDVEKSLEGHLPARHKHLLPKNYEASKGDLTRRRK